MKIKTSNVEKAFLMGIGLQYLLQKFGTSNILYAISGELRERCKPDKPDKTVDPMGDDV